MTTGLRLSVPTLSVHFRTGKCASAQSVPAFIDLSKTKWAAQASRLRARKAAASGVIGTEPIIFCIFSFTNSTFALSATLANVSVIIFAPGSVGAYQDSKGGDGCNGPSPLFLPRQIRRICCLSLSCPRTRQRDTIASSNRSLNCSLSRRSNLRRCHCSAIDWTRSRTFSRSLVISFMDALQKPHALTPRVSFNQSTTRKSPTASYLKMPSQTDGFALDAPRSPENIGTSSLSRLTSIFLPKKPFTCPKTPYESGVIRQSHRRVRCSRDGDSRSLVFPARVTPVEMRKVSAPRLGRPYRTKRPGLSPEAWPGAESLGNQLSPWQEPRWDAERRARSARRGL